MEKQRQVLIANASSFPSKFIEAETITMLSEGATSIGNTLPVHVPLIPTAEWKGVRLTSCYYGQSNLIIIVDADDSHKDVKIEYISKCRPYCSTSVITIRLTTPVHRQCKNVIRCISDQANLDMVDTYKLGRLSETVKHKELTSTTIDCMIINCSAMPGVAGLNMLNKFKGCNITTLESRDWVEKFIWDINLQLPITMNTKHSSPISEYSSPETARDSWITSGYRMMPTVIGPRPISECRLESETDEHKSKIIMELVITVLQWLINRAIAIVITIVDVAKTIFTNNPTKNQKRENEDNEPSSSNEQNNQQQDDV